MRYQKQLQSFKGRLRSTDLFQIRGVPSQYHKGMRFFWIYGVFVSTSAAFLLNYVSLYALSLGATALQIGTLSSVSSLMAMLGPIPGAQWAARSGKRKEVFLVSASIRQLVVFLLLLVPWFFGGTTAIIAVMVLVGLRTGLINFGLPAWTSIAGDLVPMDRRGRYYSSRKSVMALCSLLFVPLAGQVIEWIGEPLGYQVSFGISVLIGVIAVAIYARIPDRGASDQKQQDKDPSAFWRALVDNRTFLLFTLASMVFNFAWQMGGPYFGVYQVKVLGATPRIVGVISMASALARIFGQQFWGRMIDRHGARWSLSMCLLIIPVLPFIWFPMTNAWHVLFVAIPSGFLWGGRELANFNLQLELPSKRYQTQAIASYTTLLGVANMIAPLVGGPVIETLGYKWDFAFSGIGRMIGALLIVMLLKPFGKQQPT